MGRSTSIEWADATLNLWTGCTKVSDGCRFCYAEHLRDKRFGKSEWGPAGKRTEVRSWRSTLRQLVRLAPHFAQCTGCDSRGDARTWNEDIQARHPTARTCCPDRDLQPARLRVFCSSLSDVFEGPETMGGSNGANYVATTNLRSALVEAIYDHPELDFLLLTKRPQNVQELWDEACSYLVMERSGPHPFPDNVWIGTSVEDQATADERIPHLLKIPAKVRFLSCEPLLGPVDLSKWMPPGRICARCSGCGTFTSDRRALTGCAGYCQDPSGKSCNGLPCPTCGRVHYWSGSYIDQSSQVVHWVIAGGESGAKARPMHPDWARSLRDQCVAAKVPFFFKQWGEWLPASDEVRDLIEKPLGQLNPWEFPAYQLANRISQKVGNAWVSKVGKKAAGRDLDGQTWSQFPEVTR